MRKTEILDHSCAFAHVRDKPGDILIRFKTGKNIDKSSAWVFSCHIVMVCLKTGLEIAVISLKVGI